MKIAQKMGLLIFTLSIALACSDKRIQTLEEMLENVEQRNEMMIKISEDKKMSMEMMDRMSKSNYCEDVMMEDHGMMDSLMMHDEGMMHKMMGKMFDMADKDSMHCMKMHDMIMGDDHMKAIIMDMCDQDGMKMEEGMMKMSEEHMSMHRHHERD